MPTSELPQLESDVMQLLTSRRKALTLDEIESGLGKVMEERGADVIDVKSAIEELEYQGKVKFLEDWRVSRVR